MALAQSERDEATRLLGGAKEIFDTLPPFLPPADAAEWADILADFLAGLAQKS